MDIAVQRCSGEVKQTQHFLFVTNLPSSSPQPPKIM